MRHEVKANYLLRGGGDIRLLDLAPKERFLVYRAHLRQLRELPARGFAVVVDKRSIAADQCFDTAWETLLQRLETTSRKESQVFSIIHDQGENDAIRRWARRARRHLPAGSAFGTGPIYNKAALLVDDPQPVESRHSYFLQFADLVAYAGFRTLVAPSASIESVCPASMWEEIGPATHAAVNQLKPRGGIPGVVVRTT
jgi:hypothetical protein